MTSLTRKVAGGTAWNGIASGIEMAVGLATTLLLMKCLPPEDFGLVAAAGVFVNLAGRVGQGSIRTALIQHNNEDGLYLSGFAGSLLLVVPVTLAMAGLAGPIAMLYGETRMAPVVLMLTLGMCVGGIGMVPRAYLERNMLFNKVAVITVAATTISSVTALGMAWFGLGVWALVAQLVVRSLAGTVLSWGCMRFSLLRGWSGQTIIDLMRYGCKVVASDLLSMAGPSGVRFIIGKMLGASALGFYAAAWRIVGMPVQAVSNPFSVAAFPALCRKQDDARALSDAYLRLVAAQVALIGPGVVAAGMAVSHLVPLLGEEWLAVVPVARILMGLLLFSLAFGSSYLAFLAAGRPGYRFWYQAANAAALLTGTLVGARWGLAGATIGMLAGSLAAVPVQFYLLRRAGLVRLRDYLAALVRPLGIVGLVFAVCALALAVASRADLGHPASLLCIALSAGVTYMLAVRYLFRGPLRMLAEAFPDGRIRRTLSAFVR